MKTVETTYQKRRTALRRPPESRRESFSGIEFVFKYPDKLFSLLRNLREDVTHKAGSAACCIGFIGVDVHCERIFRADSDNNVTENE